MQSTDSDTITFAGGECKALGNGKVGGYLVLFGTPEATDLSAQRDYFTAETDFGIAGKSRVLFDHGLDPILGRSELGQAELKIDAKGVWAEGVLKAREGYSAAVKEIIGKDLPTLIAGKKLGWSSGTAPHLIERVQQRNGSNWIKSWPLGLDASLTATPAEPRTLAVPLKSWVPSFAKGIHLGGRAEVGAAMAAVQHLHGRLHEATWDAMGDEKSLPADRLKKIGAAYDECKSTCMTCMKALLGQKAKGEAGIGNDEGDGAAIKAAERQLLAELMAIDTEADKLRLLTEG